jgi:RNA polymerase sporulation-specific sigma factor
VYHDGADAIFVMDQVSDEKNIDHKWLENLSLTEALKRLSEREKHILSLRFFEGKTQMEVADEIGITYSEMQYIFTRCLDAYKGNYDTIFNVEIKVAI